MIAITPAKIFSKEVAQNRPPHFPARTSSPPEIVSDQISGDEAVMRSDRKKPNVVEKDEPPKEPTESNDRSDGDSEEERRRLEELQRAEARRAAEEKRRREEAKNEPFWNRFLAMLRARDS
jgi:hypothetical protein